MKRTLTQDILEQFKTASPCARSPPSLRKEISGIRKMVDSAKRVRTAAFNGGARAESLLLHRLLPGQKFDTAEFLNAVDLPKDVIGEDVFANLATLVSNFKVKLDECSSHRQLKSTLAERVCKTLVNLARAKDKLLEMENDKHMAAVDELLRDLVSCGNEQQLRRLHLLNSVAKGHINVFKDVCRSKAEAYQLLGRCQNDIQDCVKATEQEMVEQRAALLAAESRSVGCRKSLAALDEEIGKYIHENAGAFQTGESRSSTLSVCLDALLSPTPAMNQLTDKRAQLKRDLVDCDANVANVTTARQLFELTVHLMRWSTTALAGQAKDSVTRSSKNRVDGMRNSQRGLIHCIEDFKVAIKAYVAVHSEKFEYCARKMRERKEELDRHIRLTGDSAPAELREIKSKLEENETMVSSLQRDLSELCKSTAELWTSALVRPETLVREAVAPTAQATAASDTARAMFRLAESETGGSDVILPREVLVALQVALHNILASPECQGCRELQQTFRDVLKRVEGFCPPLAAPVGAGSPSRRPAARQLAESGSRETALQRFSRDLALVERRLESSSSSSASSDEDDESVSDDASSDAADAEAARFDREMKNRGGGCVIC